MWGTLCALADYIHIGCGCQYITVYFATYYTVLLYSNPLTLVDYYPLYRLQDRPICFWPDGVGGIKIHHIIVFVVVGINIYKAY